MKATAMETKELGGRMEREVETKWKEQTYRMSGVKT